MLKELWKERQQLVEEQLVRELEQEPPLDARLAESMRYSLMAGGKRLRPILLMAAADAVGAKGTDYLTAACALEMIHTYSLIHDDLPAMDNDDYRRGKLTNHKVYGEATAVLAGDALLTAAFGQLAAAKLPAERIAKAVAALARCAGELGMVGGQVLDMNAETRLCTEQEVYDIQSRKTGALISAACQLGVIAAGGTAAQLAEAVRYAETIGLAFQIEDDILDVIGDAKKLGKATGMDETKNTFVRLYGIDRCREMIAEQTATALQAAEALNAPFLGELAKTLQNRDY